MAVVSEVGTVGSTIGPAAADPTECSKVLILSQDSLKSVESRSGLALSMSRGLNALLGALYDDGIRKFLVICVVRHMAIV
jgi:hypothetical protein